MKIYLASFFEPENHGPGRKIGISPSKPKTLLEEYGYDCDLMYDALSPGDVYWDYHKAKKIAGDNKKELELAGDNFVIGYKEKLSQLKEVAEEASKNTNSSIIDVLGFEDGDTLLSWERSGNTSYREHVANFLREVGYEVEEQ